MPDRVFVGIGSNIDPDTNLRWALKQLERSFGQLERSSVYQSEAFGFDGPDFLNMVVGFTTGLDADRVESVLSGLEEERGRGRRDRSGSRALDLDLLLYGRRVDAGRRLPRADVLRYSFVLVPLRDIAPELIHPVTGLSIADALNAVGDYQPMLRPPSTAMI